jgi:phosphoribosylformylglycinamidine cyclo-ligase
LDHLHSYDLIVQGAEPLFFLDYYATGKLNTEIAVSVISGIGEGCKQFLSNFAAKFSGKTLGIFSNKPPPVICEMACTEYFLSKDKEKEDVIDGTKVTNGDHIIALGSSGPHSNGYSLIRKVLECTEPTEHQLFFFSNANTKTCQIVIFTAVHTRHFSSFTANQRTA